LEVYYNRKGEPIPLEEWATGFEGDRIISQDIVGEHFVSTVFLGLDHRFGSGPPLIFETMIFCRHEPKRNKYMPWKIRPCSLDNYQDRYSTEEEAATGHIRAMNLVKKHDRVRSER
jgi:hypothetical protein